MMMAIVIILSVIVGALIVSNQKIVKELSNRMHQAQRLKGELHTSECLRKYAEAKLAIYDEEHLELTSAVYQMESFDYHKLVRDIKKILDRRFNKRSEINLDFKE